MDDHAEQLAKHLLEVEGGREVLESRERELDPEVRPPEPRIPDEAQRRLRARAVVLRYGVGPLGPDFWSLPMPEDPEASVRRAVEEDRR